MADNDKILVKIKGNPSVKVTDDQTIVREIKVGTPIKRVQPFGNDYNNLLNRPNILDSDDVLALVDAQDLANIVDSGSGVSILGAVTVSGHIIPSADGQYDLGSPTNRFRSLYVGGQTLYIGSLALSEDSFGNVVISNTDENGEIILGTGQTVSTNIDSNQIRNIAKPIVDSEIALLIGGAPEVLNTLEELARAINNDDSFSLNLVETIAAQGEAIEAKFNQADFDSSARALIDSDYINARVTRLDSDDVTGIIDSAYISARVGGGTIGTPDDGVYSDGAIGLTNLTTVANAVDDLNEALLNIANNTFVKSVTFTGSPLAGGAGTTVTLTLTTVGNPNRYDIDWGDGSTDLATTDNTPSHTYTSNSGSPYTVTVRAFNNTGSGSGSEASATNTDYIIIYTADPVAAFQLYRASSGGTSLTGNDLYVIEGNNLYLENTTTNTSGADVSYTVNWGDGSSNSAVDSDGAEGGVTGARLEHTWAAGTTSGTGTDTVTLTLDSHSTATPSVVPTSATLSLKVYDDAPSAPNGLSSKSISYGFTSVGSSPYLASGFTDNTSGASISAGNSVNRVTTSGSVESTVISTFAYDADAGSLSAVVNGSTDGTISLTSADNTGSNSSVVITEESDYNLLDASGSSTTFANSIYYPGLYKGFKAKVSKSSLSTGVNSYQLSHSTQGDTNTIEFVKDDLTNTPTISSSGSLTENVSGTYRYVSGIPYYNSGSPSLTLSGVQIDDLVGQTYRNSSDIVQVVSGTNYEGTSSSAISTQSYTYANIDGSSTMLSSGIPLVNTGVGSAYAIGNLTVPLTSSSVRTVEQISVRSSNVNGTGSSSAITGKIQVHTASQSGISEIAIAVSDALGSTYDDDGVRIFDFSAATTDNPSYTSSTNFYTNSLYTESSDPGVSGTKEATVRIGQIKHDVTDYSSGFFPAGPNRSGDTGTQYFTFAFRRTSVANFSINITSSGVAGVWIAAPGTTIDNASSLNGWLDCSAQYNGAGVPGANTGSGGNGSNGCASTGSDVIASSTSLSGSYTMTLGTENLSNATNNVALVRIALTSGQSVTSLSIS